MRVYSESFKKSVVKKALCEGVVKGRLACKLGISKSTLMIWIRKYRNVITPEKLDLDSIVSDCKEKELDIDFFLYQAP